MRTKRVPDGFMTISAVRILLVVFLVASVPTASLGSLSASQSDAHVPTRTGTFPGLGVAKARTVLEKILVECRCILPGMPTALLSRVVTDAGFFTDDDVFFVAYWTGDPAAQFSSNVPMRLILGDRHRGLWREQDIPFRADKDLDGPFESIHRSNGLFVIKRQVATDGGSAILVSPDLEKLGNVYYELGSEPLVFPSGLVVYQRGQPHFTPTHYVEFAAYDTRTKSERNVYPVKPFEPVRRQFITRVRQRWARLGVEWFNRNNHHGDPELFETHTHGYAVDGSLKAVAFRLQYVDYATYDPAQGVKLDEISEEVLVVCDGLSARAGVRCHETPITSWQALYPGESPEAILRHAAAAASRTPRR
jgi:hypothetical protein